MNTSGYYFRKINNDLKNIRWRWFDRSCEAVCVQKRNKGSTEQYAYIGHSKNYVTWVSAREAGWWPKENNLAKELKWMGGLSCPSTTQEAETHLCWRVRSLSLGFGQSHSLREPGSLAGLQVCQQSAGFFRATTMAAFRNGLCGLAAGGAVGYLHTGDFLIGWEETRGSFWLTVYTLPPASTGCGFKWRMLLRTTVSPKSHIYSMAQACIHSPRRLYYSQKKLIKTSHAS